MALTAGEYEIDIRKPLDIRTQQGFHSLVGIARYRLKLVECHNTPVIRLFLYILHLTIVFLIFRINLYKPKLMHNRTI